jgi:hypothetical protein
LEMTDKVCVVCDATLVDSQRLFCSNRCKMAAKYDQKRGLRCKFCKKPMKPKPVMGGMKQDCDRVRCKANRPKEK